MGVFGGGFLRLTSTFFYAIEFCCAAIILGIYSYFLAVLSDRKEPIARKLKAVEGISGVAVIYTIFAVLLTCFLGGIKIFAFLAILLDVLFCAGFIALAVLTRDGAHSCTGLVNTPLGSGQANAASEGFAGRATYQSSPGTACRLNTACFAVSIVGAVFFAISVLMQVAVARHAQKEKKYGPSPANNYTSGSGNKFWKRKQKPSNKDAEMSDYPTTGTAVTADRPSYDTGTTLGQQADPYTINKPMDHAGYQTGPTNASVNPYGYDNTRGTASNF